MTRYGRADAASRSADEGELIRRAASGDDEAFLALVDRHRDRVFSVACLTLHDGALAAEVTQDVFVSLFRSLSRFRRDAGLGTWLYRVTINSCIDVLRRRRRDRRNVPIDAVSEHLLLSDGEAEAFAIREADQRLVRAAVNRLPHDLRAVVSLRYGGGLTYADVARTLGLPLGTVCTRLHRALKALGDDLGRNPSEDR